MPLHLIVEEESDARPLRVLSRDGYAAWRAEQPALIQSWLDGNGFEPALGRSCLLPGSDGAPGSAIFIPDPDDLWCWAALAERLPPGAYRLDGALEKEQAAWAVQSWALAGYRFDRYKSASGEECDRARLVWPGRIDRGAVGRSVRAITLVRDLINTPASDMGPEDLALAAEDLARSYGAKVRTIVGDALLRENYPLIHAVGRASSRVPRLIDLRWGDETKPRVTLVGKGVCFDSGGLDIKGAANMKAMKKDMGGAAHVLGLAMMIMDAALPVRLRVLIPAVENAVSGSSFRPLDILRSRKGLSVEIGNTDAEGRLVLADCLAEAGSENPALLVDMATLTGAARTALGPELPALFSTHDDWAEALLAASRARRDPLWRLPLWRPYRRMLDSPVADINNAPDSAFAGAVTAALFLAEFVPATTPWLHLDIFGWNQTARPGRPEGGEAMAIRALFDLIAGGRL
ncbi:MAG: leucyl aminopeptidase family protein [Rhodospirillaceae bacterium]|nr:leucyl aminopeptidase family protein [Rhodospirillaceae bacterium]